jgi:hypothetical protein
MTVDSSWSERALHHAQHIVTRIGPRGATSPEEKQAAVYVQHQLQQLGWPEARVESFRARPNGWLPVAIIFSIAVWSVFACWSLFYLSHALAARSDNLTSPNLLSLPGALVAAGISGSALLLLYLEVTLRDPLARRLARGISHNTIGHLPPAGSIKQRVVLVCSLDTAPAAPVFRSPERVRVFRTLFYAGSVSLIGSVVLYVLGGWEIWSWAFILAGIFGLLQSAVLVEALRAHHGALSPGANHNASGLGVGLALAERLRSEPLGQTEVWLAACGSHVSSEGVHQLLQQHRAELDAAWFIGLEGVGRGDRLVAISREGWLRRSVSPAIRELIARAAVAHPERPITLRPTSRNTLVTAALWQGFNSVCVSVYEQRDEIPHAYQLADTLEQLQLSALDTAQEFGWQLLQQIDRE